MARAHQRQRVAAVQHALDQQLDPAAAAFVPEQPRLDHASIVQHQHVVGLQQAREIGEASIRQRISSGIQGQEAAITALRRRSLRNQLGRQIEVERIELHGRGL